MNLREAGLGCVWMTHVLYTYFVCASDTTRNHCLPVTSCGEAEPIHGASDTPDARLPLFPSRPTASSLANLERRLISGPFQ